MDLTQHLLLASPEKSQISLVGRGLNSLLSSRDLSHKKSVEFNGAPGVSLFY